MNARALSILAGATIVAAAAAAIGLRGREAAVKATSEGGKLFPALASALNDAASISVKRKDGSYELRKSGDVWGLAEKQGFPVDLAAVRKLLIGIGDLATIEKKTADPARHAALGVQEPDVEGSTSSLVTVKDSSGNELAGLVVGKAHSSKAFSATPQVYVRRAGDPQAWLASGSLDVHEKGAEWLEKKILEVKRERVRSVEVRHNDGETTFVDRDKAETQDFALRDIPEGKELTYPTVAGSIASALEWLNLEDVVPAGEVDMQEGTAATAKFTCFDGLVVSVVTKDVDEKTYARFEAAFEPPPEAVGPPAPPESGKKEGEASAGEGKKEGDAAAEKKDEPEKPKTKSAEEVKQEVELLNAKLSAWTFVIPSYNKSSFQKRKSEMLKDKAPPPGTPPETPKDESVPAGPPKPGGESPPPPPVTPPPDEPPH